MMLDISPAGRRQTEISTAADYANDIKLLAIQHGVSTEAMFCAVASFSLGDSKFTDNVSVVLDNARSLGLIV